MNKILFVNACVRENSRTLELAQSVLNNLQGEREDVNLYNIKLLPLDKKGIEARDKASSTNDFSGEIFKLAMQFSKADTIVIAAPFWDMMFPAVLKTYFENVTVCGLTFKYSPSGIPQGLCRARSLYYVTTAGGFIGKNDFGFLYVKALAQNFFNIKNVYQISAEGLDIMGADVNKILQKAKNDITLIKNDTI